jgi:hypothetical protein
MSKYKNPNYQIEWRANNTEHLKVSRKNYYEANKTILLEKYKNKYHEPDTKARKKSYYNENKAKILAKAKAKYAKKKAEKKEAAAAELKSKL